MQLQQHATANCQEGTECRLSVCVGRNERTQWLFFFSLHQIFDKRYDDVPECALRLCRVAGSDVTSSELFIVDITRGQEEEEEEEEERLEVKSKRKKGDREGKVWPSDPDPGSALSAHSSHSSRRGGLANSSSSSSPLYFILFYFLSRFLNNVCCDPPPQPAPTYSQVYRAYSTLGKRLEKKLSSR